MDLVLNGLIALITLTLTLCFSRKDGAWTLRGLKKALRFFTVQSNLLCALGALLMCFWPDSRPVWLLKYAGTAAVTLTMLTVLLFLGPTLGCWRKLFSGADLFMHLITPLLALVSFCVLERRGLGFPALLLGLLPMALYAVLYACKVLLAPPEKAWEDFYGFNRGGKWYLSVCLMLLGTLLICLGLAALQSL